MDILQSNDNDIPSIRKQLITFLMYTYLLLVYSYTGVMVYSCSASASSR